MRQFWFTPDEIIEFFNERKKMNRLEKLRIEQDWLDMHKDLAKVETERNELKAELENIVTGILLEERVYNTLDTRELNILANAQRTLKAVKP